MSRTSESDANSRRNSRGWLERLRRLVDGDDGDVVETLSELTRPRLRARDLFYKQLALQIDELLNQEAFGPPNVPLTVPTEIEVFVAPDINASWLNHVRRRLLDGLNTTIAQRVREMAGPSANRTRPPVISLSEDPALDLGGVRLKSHWGESTQSSPESIDPEITQVYLEPEDGESTIVITPAAALYHVDVFGSGSHERVAVAKPHATIGRGTKNQPPDVRLRDRAVSRTHAVLDYEQSGLWLTALGQNGIRISGQPLARRHRRRVRAGERIEICGFTLQISEPLAA
jgi:hypothetical protein